jgi:hypothetical protein
VPEEVKHVYLSINYVFLNIPGAADDRSALMGLLVVKKITFLKGDISE